MARLVYLTGALRDLAKIAAELEDAGKSRDFATGFVEKLTDYCEHVAELPGLLGRAREELRPNYRSLTFGNYVIFFRYRDGVVARETLEVIHVVFGARDLEAFFRRHYGDS